MGQIDPTGYYFGMKPYETEHACLVGACAPPGPDRLRRRPGRPVGLAGRRRRARPAPPGERRGDDRQQADEPRPRALESPGLDPGAPAGHRERVAGLRAHHPPHGRPDPLPPGARLLGGARLLAPGGPRGPSGTVRLWYLAAGCAFFLNQYPRMDTIHLLWSAGPLLVAGADVLSRLYRGRHRQRPGPAPLRPAPAARSPWPSSPSPPIACLPHFYWRLLTWSALSPRQRGEVHAAGARAQERLAPLDLPRGGRVWMREADAEPVQEVVELLMARTAPGEPVFTYPAIPGFAYLADRPAATRYLHLFPGMARRVRAGEPGAAAGGGALRGVGRRRGPLLGAPGGQRPGHGVRPHPASGWSASSAPTPSSPGTPPGPPSRTPFPVGPVRAPDRSSLVV